MATRTDPNIKTQADGTHVPEADEAPRPRFEDRIKFEDLGKYEEITLPPHARLKWLAAELPSAPPEVLQDTVPPNGGVKAPAKPKSEPAVSEPAPPVTREPKRASAPTARLPEPLAEQKTLLVPRVRRKRRLRQIVVLAMGAAAMLIVVGVILSRRSPSDDPPAPAVAQPVVAPQPKAGTEPATRKPALATPAVTTSAAPSRSPAALAPSSPAPAVKRDGHPKQQAKPAPATPSNPPAPTNDFDLRKPFED